MKQIALYGKGGIGKSTTSANLSAALSEKKLSIMQIGCDPKHDSTRMLMGGRWIPTVLDTIRDKGEEINADEIVFTGYNNIRCVEAGGPETGVGCAGRIMNLGDNIIDVAVNAELKISIRCLRNSAT